MVFAHAILFKPTIADLQSAVREFSNKPSRMFRTNENAPQDVTSIYANELRPSWTGAARGWCGAVPLIHDGRPKLLSLFPPKNVPVYT